MLSCQIEGNGWPALVFLHGWANDRNIWDQQVPYFAKSRTVVAVDLAGFGDSEKKRGLWTMSSFGEDVVGLVEELELAEVVLVGFSMGALVAVEAATRLQDRVVGVVVVDMLQDVTLQYAPEMLDQLEGVFMDLATNPTLEKMVEGGFITVDLEKSYERILSMLEGAPRIGWRETLRNAFEWQNEACKESLGKLAAPVTAINSDREPTNVAAFRQLVPSFRLKVIQGAGHVVMWDATDQFNQLLEESIAEFLSG